LRDNQHFGEGSIVVGVALRVDGMKRKNYATRRKKTR
jgi:hypothetical protein